MSILIVDDNEQNLCLLQVVLEGNGYQVVAVANGVEALAKARQNPPDLIISDILMPAMDGFSLCREWKKDERLRSIPFIFYTATYTDARDRELALSLGAERFLVKPVESEVFLQTIREVIQLAQRQPAAPTRVPIEAPPQEETGYLKQYNEVLIRKLEVKMEQLEQANRELYHDITERKQAEETLVKCENRYRTLFESSHDAIMTLEPPSWKFTSGNLAMMKMFMAKDEDFFTFHDPWSLSPERQPDGRVSVEKAKEMIEMAVRDGSNFFEWTHKRLNGEEFMVTIQLTRMVLDEKTILQATIRDITERKKSKEVLRSSEEKFRVIFDNANDGILLADAMGKNFHIGNNAICQMLGYSLEEIKNLSVADIHPKEDLPYVMGQFERQIRKEIKVSKDLPMKRKDGSIFYVDVNSSPVTLDGIKYLLGIFRDVTERKKMEEEALKRLQELEVFYKASIGREERIIELKQEIEQLKKELGK